jgi:hypothetical protein
MIEDARRQQRDTYHRCDNAQQPADTGHRLAARFHHQIGAKGQYNRAKKTRISEKNLIVIPRHRTAMYGAAR